MPDIICATCSHVCCRDCDAIAIKGCGKFAVGGQGWLNMINPVSLVADFTCALCKHGSNWHYFSNKPYGRQLA